MSGYYFLAPMLLVIFISFLVVRAGAIALMLTGMDYERAHFQSLSAFTGTGFTTREAEFVTNHPQRRKIISWMMILGNAGIATVIVTGTSSLVVSKGANLSIVIGIILVGISLIYKIASSRGFVIRWESFIERRFRKMHAFEEGISENLLHLIEGYGLVRVNVKEGSELVGSSLSDHKLSSKGLLVLGIERGNSWIPVPKAIEKIRKDDMLVVYGSFKKLNTAFKEKKKA